MYSGVLFCLARIFNLSIRLTAYPYPCLGFGRVIGQRLRAKAVRYLYITERALYLLGAADLNKMYHQHRP